MTQVPTAADQGTATARMAGRIAELEHDQFVDREIIADQQDKIIEREMANEHLEIALGSSRRIGIAIGIVMAAKKVTAAQAFEVLQASSQRQNRKLRLIADDVVLTGAF